MHVLPIYQVDAFSSRLFGGNPAAVVVLDAFPDDALLHAIAAENNLAETAFLVPHDGQYRLRWFTPLIEVPLCGHATLASAAVVMERLAPGRTEVVFHTASGDLGVRRSATGYVLDFPARKPEPVPTPSGLAAALGCEPLEVLDDGFVYTAVLLDARTVRELAPDVDAIARLARPGLAVTAPGDGPYDCVSRYFAPGQRRARGSRHRQRPLRIGAILGQAPGQDDTIRLPGLAPWRRTRMPAGRRPGRA